MFGGFFGGSNEKPSSSDKVSETTSNTPKSIHGFDPDALERAAKAARELDLSKNSQNALRVIQEQEFTKQKELEMERAKYLAMQEQYSLKKIEQSQLVARRTLEEQTRHERERAEYRDELERKRMVDQINAQRHLQEEERSKNEESLKRQEAIRRKTLEYEFELRRKTEMAKVEAEVKGRILQERQNHDLILEKKLIEAREYRETVLESVTLAGSIVGNGIRNFLTDKERLFNIVATTTGLAFGIYASKTSVRVVGRIVESTIGKPSLVRETSRKNILSMMKTPIRSIYSLIMPTRVENPLRNIILNTSLEKRLERVVTGTRNTKMNKASYRNILLAGPPGTGKTLFAKSLAQECGLHYAIMTGGDVAPLGNMASNEIHKLFDWTNSTNKGVVLFIDEADAFLRKRNVEKLSEELRSALNAFLYRTGEASKHVMVIFASNQPEQFDWAINDRIDEIILFDSPALSERIRMIKMYIKRYITSVSEYSGSQPIKVEGLDDSTIEHIAHETEGFSGREISKLAIAWQAAAYGTADVTLTREMLFNVLNETKESKNLKQLWLQNERITHHSV